MRKPKEHKHEKERLKELDSYSILDTLPEADYDNLTAIASEICNTPISLVSLLDEKRQWFKSHHGINVDATPKEYAFCAHAITQPEDVFVIEDARVDERFHDNPLVVNDPNVVFYAGVPLKSRNGYPLGTLCVIDHKPKVLRPGQRKSLQALADQVMNLMELRKKNSLLEKSNKELEQTNEMLEKFAHHAAHDIKSPLSNITSLSQMFQSQYGDKIDEKGKEYIKLIERSADKLGRLVDGLLESSKTSQIVEQDKNTFDLNELSGEMSDLFPRSEDYDISYEFDGEMVIANYTAIKRILVNLISNAIKYSDRATAQIKVGMREDEQFYEFFVSDNGPGIEAANLEKIFNMFFVLKPVDRYGDFGTGIGLANVKKLVEQMGGEIEVESEKGKGTIFIFTIKK